MTGPLKASSPLAKPVTAYLYGKIASLKFMYLLKRRANRSWKFCPPLFVLNVEAKETGRTALDKQKMASFNVTVAYIAVTDSVKQV